MKYNVKDLPNRCYSITPTDKYLLKAGKPVNVIVIDKGCKGFYQTSSPKQVNSMDHLRELNMIVFDISDDNVRQIMQDYSVMGHWGLLSILNEKEGA